jgi:hypothetical protein
MPFDTRNLRFRRRRLGSTEEWKNVLGTSVASHLRLNKGTLLGAADEPASTSSDQHQKAFAILTLGWLPSPAPKAM